MANRHVIGEQRFEIQVSTTDGVHELQHQLSTHFWTSMLPALEALFDRLAGPDEWICIPRIEIDAGTLTPEALLSDAFIQDIALQIEQEIAHQLLQREPDAVRQSLPRGHFERWLYFLEHGYLPYEAAWPASMQEWHQGVFEKLAVDPLAIRRLGLLIERKPKALQRLLYQHDDAFLEQLIGIYTGQKQHALAASISQYVTRLVALIQAIASSEISITDLKKPDRLAAQLQLFLQRQLQERQDLEALKQYIPALEQWLLRHLQDAVSKTTVHWEVTFRTTLWLQVIQIRRHFIAKEGNGLPTARSSKSQWSGPIGAFYNQRRK